MSDRSRKTSDIVKHVDEVEETIPDFYGPQQSEPVGEFKKGDMWFVSEEEVLSLPSPKKRTKPLKKAKTIQQKVYRLHKKGRR